jgi:hypothetical protein
MCNQQIEIGFVREWHLAGEIVEIGRILAENNELLDEANKRRAQ